MSRGRQNRDSFNNRPFARVAGELKRDLRRRRKEAAEAAARARDARRAPNPAPMVDDPDPGGEDLDDLSLFRREMFGVCPMDRQNMAPVERDLAPPRPLDDDAEAMAELADLTAGLRSFDISDGDEYMEGIVQGLDRRLLKRLRRGFFAVQRHQDLHGLIREEAHTRVREFILGCRRQGRRCVLIVHGRGLNSKDQIPVLKASLKVWLSKGQISRSVLAFCTARPADGGAGAVYVLLRK